MAESEPKDLEQVKLNEAQSKSQFPEFLVLDKPNGKKSLIKIEKQSGEKGIIQKQTGAQILIFKKFKSYAQQFFYLESKLPLFILRNEE